MNTKLKASCIFFTVVVLILFFLSMNAAYSDAPGVVEPGKRVPARTPKAAAVQKQTKAPAKAPVKRVSRARKVQPVAVKPVARPKVNVLNEAIALIKQERYRKALPYILCATELQPGNPDTWYWFGVWSNMTGNYSNAQRYFTKALDIDPNYPALSRVVVYPGDPYGKNPIWDSVRPATIEVILPVSGVDVIAYDSPESLSARAEQPVYQPPAP
jgi:tetratricopeptide (TPR) repeat protein